MEADDLQGQCQFGGRKVLRFNGTNKSDIFIHKPGGVRMNLISGRLTDSTKNLEFRV